MEEDERRAPFNMAIATLKRLDLILQQIKQLGFIYREGSIDKQTAHIGLVKQFLINASPLLGEADTKDYQDKILSLKINKKLMISSGLQRYAEYYDEKIDQRLSELMIDMQLKLKRFFMPSGDEDDWEL